MFRITTLALAHLQNASENLKMWVEISKAQYLVRILFLCHIFGYISPSDCYSSGDWQEYFGTCVIQ